MKKFLKLTTCLLIAIATIGLTACGSNPKPSVNTSIKSVGNGGISVISNGYVYFVNGYSSYESYTKSNLSNKFEVGGLYRAKLNEYGKVTYDDKGNIENLTRISGDLAGFESTSLYVFGDHIFYTKPTTNVDKQGELQTSKIDFCKMNLDGSNSTIIYSSKNEAKDIDFEYYYADGGIYLLVNEKGTLTRINCWGKFNKEVVDEDVKSVVLHKVEDDVFESDAYKQIFYTTINEDSKIVINNYNILSGEKYSVTTNYKTCELLDYQFNHLYYKASENSYPSKTYVYRIDATNNALKNMMHERVTQTEYTNFYFLENETDGYIAQTSDKTYYLSYTAGGIGEAYPIADSKLEIMTVAEGKIYFKSSNDIKYIDYYDFKQNPNTVATQHTLVTVTDMQTYDYDIDTNYLYVYAKKGENTYLYNIYINNIIEGETIEAKHLGSYLSTDIEEEKE